MTDQDAFDKWFAKRDVWPRITYDEVWHAALAWLRSQNEPVAWMLDGEIYEVKQHNLFGGDGEIPGQIPLFLAPRPAIPAGWQSKASRDVLAERRRQVEAEGLVAKWQAWAMLPREE